MNDTVTITHERLQAALQAAEADCGAAESHGLMCGVICSAGPSDPALCLDHLLAAGNALGVTTQAARSLLAELYSESLLGLDEGDPGLPLLLPDEDTPLPLRSQALGEWCRGFLYGLALGGVREDRECQGNVSEIMHDLFEIANTRFDHASTDDDEDTAYAEIVEYVRMSVLLCREELRPAQAWERLQ